MEYGLKDLNFIVLFINLLICNFVLIWKYFQSSYDKCHVADVDLTELALEKGSPLLVKSSSNPRLPPLQEVGALGWTSAPRFFSDNPVN